MKGTSVVAVCVLAMCLVEETCCKAIAKGGNNNVPLKGRKNSPSDVDVIHSKPKLQSTTKLEPSGREMDVDDTSDLVIHDRRELQATGEPCEKGGVACRRRKKRQFSKLLNDPRRSTPGTNGVYDLQTVDNIHDEKSFFSDSLFDDDDDEDGHIMILRQRKRRDSDISSDDSDEASMFDDIGGDKPSYSEILGSYLHGEDDMPFRAKRDMLSDSAFTDELEKDSNDDNDNEDDTDLSISSEDWSLPLLKDRLKRETDTSSLDTFEEENDEIFDDVVDDDDTDDESVKSDVDKKTVKKRQQAGLPNKRILQEPANQDKTKDIPNNFGLVDRDKSLMNKKYTTSHRTGQMIKQHVPELQDEDADDDTSSSNAKNSGPETESDAELSDIPLDAQSGVVLDRVPRDSQDITVYEEGGEPNSGENNSFQARGKGQVGTWSGRRGIPVV
ncbi:nucleolin-like isoform X2 [Mizuhopecten yessoensis]|uniref:nucleolin-like isoform X2 n=1 Tax=Mizuhopecten yessoensis TaxID=6573 RepID=UPI000B45D84F|nr:nucleolin-like isoform X2 [Mizuhopecten yessoensis]